MIRIVVGLLLMSFVCSCNKPQPDPSDRPRFLLSEDSREWFSIIEDSISMKSDNGLSEIYKIGRFKMTPLTTINGTLGYGESYSLRMTPSLGEFDFGLAISNEDGHETIGITHLGFISGESHLVIQKFLTTSPHATTYFHYVPFGHVPNSLGLTYIGDTIINKRDYHDVFVNRINNGTYNEGQEIKEIYISISLGLVCFSTLSSVTWYRE